MIWRAMTPADLPAVGIVAARVHPEFPESADVFAERLRLYPRGCMVLTTEDAAEPLLRGYLISHPWLAKQPPALDSLLIAISVGATTYYIHDIALLPDARGNGAARAAIALIIAAARAANSTNLSLVAVNDSQGFWQRQGFERLRDAALDAKLASYGDGAHYMVRVQE